MITVKLYGLLRLDSGLKELQLEAADVKGLKRELLQATDRITRQDLEGCILLINGKPGRRTTKLKDGDEVTLLSPVAGG